MSKMMSVRQRDLFWDKLKQAYPEPRCELNWTNHFSLLMAIILSAQSTDKMVNRITEKLFPIADTPEKILRLGEDNIKQYTRFINYYNNKTHHIFELAKILVERYNGKVPDDFDTLVTLPGIGRKTANVFLNIAFHAPFIGVDTHVFRLCHRLKICEGKTPVEVEKKLQKIVPNEYKPDVALALVLQGRYICIARKPKCEICPLYEVCCADEKKDKV